MRKPKRISERIPQLIVPVTLSPSSYELYRLRLREYRKGLSVVLVSLEQEFGQSVGVVSHLFVVWRVLAAKRIQPSYAVVLICCWWMSKGQKVMIKRSEVMIFTGLSIDTCGKHLQRACREGLIIQYRSKRDYYLSHAGAEYINQLFVTVLDAIIDMYDDNK